MLLNEVLTTQSQEGPITKIKPNLPSGHVTWPAGVKHHDIHPAKEDFDNPDVMAIINRLGTVPIVTAYILPQSPKEGFDKRTNEKITAQEVERIAQLKDAIKMRSPIYVMDKEDVRLVARTAAQKIKQLDMRSKAVHGRQDRTLIHLNAVQQRIKGGNAILVPLASSSELASIFAEEASQVFGLPVIKGFEKRVGKMSRYYWTKEHKYQERPNFSDPVQAKLTKLEQQLNSLYTAKAPRGQIEAAEKEFTEFRNKAMRQATKGVGQIDQRRGIYGTQEVTSEDMLNLEGKDVIFVDDNVYEGLTIREATMALARLGIAPKSVSAIAIHEFY